ncbi:Short-chain dehydrogenase/reductase [Paramyrothecium foliicola]|nr:Short-chain dehydrogenase/reductase [Paramyrothecium foliicola]
MSGQNQFNPEKDIPLLHEKVILITGGYSGLGLEYVRQLAKHSPACIYVAGRSQTRAETAIRHLKSTGITADLRYLHMDLTSFTSIKSAVASFRENESRLDLLVHDAGIMLAPPGLTKEGYEVQFGTNYLGHAFITHLLLPVLQATSRIGVDVRVINVSSASEALLGKKQYDFEVFKTELRDESTQTRYYLSKLAQVYYSQVAAERYSDIKFICIHPGSDTTMPEKGALNQIWASVSLDAISGEFYCSVGVAVKGLKFNENKQVAEALWSWTQEEIEKYFN